MIRIGDCLQVMPTLPTDSVDAVVTDPPYGLSFMGKEWDHGVPGVEFWAEALRVAKPGAHLVAFGGTRTYHRLAVAIEDAGWEVRDCLSWLYGSGFPKSLDISKAMDKAGGDALAWRSFSAAYAKAVAESQYSHADIDRVLGVKSSSCYWARSDHRGGMPPRHHWDTVRDLLGLDADLELLYEEAEREVLIHRTMTQGGGSSLQIRTGERREVEANITAPATDLAKQWAGWGTALKPAWEPIILARKPLVGTVASNVAAHGTGGLNIDGCRIATGDKLGGGRLAGPTDMSATCGGPEWDRPWMHDEAKREEYAKRTAEKVAKAEAEGRWPANVVLDEDAAALLDAQSGELKSGANPTRRGSPKFRNAYGDFQGQESCDAARSVDRGGASRFFYCAKASRSEREAGLGDLKAIHPTVKPIALMRWLCRLVTPPGGLILDPFTGSGTTGCAAVLEGFRFVGIEQSPEYAAIAEKRIAHHTPAPKLL